MTDEAVKKVANPAPLGLLAFGMTTVLLNLHNAGAYPLDTMVLAMGIAYGGLAQVIVGALEYKNGNTFGTVAFTSYGLFWWTLILLLLLPGLTGFAGPTPESMAAYFVIWGIFTLALFFGTLNVNRALQLVFSSLVVLFFLLAVGEFAKDVTLTRVTGFEGIICGLSAVYLGVAEVLNEAHKKVVLPVFPTGDK